MGCVVECLFRVCAFGCAPGTDVALAIPPRGGDTLYLGLLGANRPSHEGVVDYYDRAIALCRQAWFTKIRLRGDTDFFSLTAQFDRWDDDNVQFVFGYDARANLIQRAESTDDELYHELAARAKRQIATQQRTRTRNVKDDIVRERNYKVLRQTAQDVVEFSLPPRQCVTPPHTTPTHTNHDPDRHPDR